MANTEMVIRPYLPADEDAVAELWRKCNLFTLLEQAEVEGGKEVNGLLDVAKEKELGILDENRRYLSQSYHEEEDANMI